MQTTLEAGPVGADDPSRGSLWWDALAGIVALGAGLAAAELVGLVTGPGSTPVVAVSDGVVDLTPAWAKDAVIAVFGTADKVFLFVVVAVVALAVGAAAGVLERRRPPLGAVLTALLAVVVMVAAGSRPDAGLLAVVPGAVAFLVGVTVLRALLRRLADPATGPDRRALLLGGTGAAALAVGLGARVVGSARGSGGEASRGPHPRSPPARPSTTSPASTRSAPRTPTSTGSTPRSSCPGCPSPTGPCGSPASSSARSS